MKISRKKFVTEWVKDLRSGKYEQTTSRLARNNGYCCLGVACKTGQRLGIKEAEFGEGQDKDDLYPGWWFQSIMRSWNPLLNKDLRCIQANDDEGLSFKEIAKLLYKRYISKK